MTDRDPSGSSIIDVIGDHAERSCALDAMGGCSAGLWNASRIAGDDRRTCCVPIDAAAFLARRRRVHERRDRRAGSVLLARSKSAAGVEEIFRGAVDSITTGWEDRGRFLESVSPLVGTTDFSKCNGRTLSSNAASNVSDHDNVNGGSPTTVRGIGGPIDGDVNTENPRTSDPRLIEIDIVESSCVLAEETVHRRSTSSTSRFPAKIDPGGHAWRTRTNTRWRLPRIGFVQRALLLGLLAMSLLCDAVLAAPSSSVFEDDIEEEELAAPRNGLGDDELEIIRRSIVHGLGLQRIPDSSKVSLVDSFWRECKAS